MKTYSLAVTLLFIIEFMIFGDLIDATRKSDYAPYWVGFLATCCFNLIAPLFVFGVYQWLKEFDS